jgi:tetratricopeptide (TPR) repeat protein
VKRLALALALAAVLPACATKAPPRLPDRDDYAYPATRPGEVPTTTREKLERAWQELQADRPAAAEKQFAAILRREPGLAAAETGLAFARLRAGQIPAASAGFAHVLAGKPDYVPALIGAGLTALREDRPEAAVAPYRRAAELEPNHVALRRRYPQAKLQATERQVAAAQAALAGGDRASAVTAYRAALEAAPEVAGVRLELADLLVQDGNRAEAEAMLADDPGGDRRVLVRLGDLRSELGQYAAALEAYRRVLARDPRDAEALRGSLLARQGLELARQPEEYRRIPGASRITRADLAALVGVKVTALARLPAGEPAVAVDISGSWARSHLLRMLSLEIMTVFPNHTFQPANQVRRGDLARVLARILELVRWPAGRSPTVVDVAPTNLLWPSVSRVLGAGLMDVTPGGAFEAWRPVTGQEAIEAVDALVRLIGS